MEPRQVKTAADARALVESRGRAARQGRRLRHRRHHARQVHLARQVPLVARQGLRLLRRRARLGLPGPALRQREVHRLAHRLSGRARATAAGHLPAAAVRGQRTVLPRRVLAAGGSGLSACLAPARARARTRDGLRSLRRLRVRVLRVQGNARVRAREGLPRPDADGARLVRLLGDPQQHGQRLLSPAARPLPRHGHGHRGPARGDRAGRDGGGHRRRQGTCSGGQGGAVQDLREGDRAAERLHGDLHGQVVEGLAGAERPHPPVAQVDSPAIRSSTRPASPIR